MALREVLTRVLADYPAAVTEGFGDHPLADYVRHEAAEAVMEALGEYGRGLLVQGSAGAGRWAAVPWLAVFDTAVTDSATREYYVVYLFSVDGRECHLSLNQGTTATRQEFGAETRRVLSDRAELMRKRIPEFASLLPIQSIHLGSKARLPIDYAAGHSLGLTYLTEQLPSEETLRGFAHGGPGLSDPDI